MLLVVPTAPVGFAFASSARVEATAVLLGRLVVAEPRENNSRGELVGKLVLVSSCRKVAWGVRGCCCDEGGHDGTPHSIWPNLLVGQELARDRPSGAGATASRQCDGYCRLSRRNSQSDRPIGQGADRRLLAAMVSTCRKGTIQLCYLTT